MKDIVLSDFWSLHEVLAFMVTGAAVAGILWRVLKRLFEQTAHTYSKIDAIEELLDQLQQKGMTAGAEKSLKRLEKRILLTQAQVRLIMEVDNTGYVETNKNGGLTYCNTQFTHWTGLSAEEAKGFGWAAAIHPEDRSRITADWVNSIKEERPVDLWFRYKRDTVETPVHARSVVVRDDGEVLGFVALIVPIDR